jgi:serine phosphatase RsbU (regulator of sigma subunit)
MKKSFSEEKKIDRSNEGLWNRRYIDPEVVASESIVLHTKSEREKYPKGIAYAKLNIAAASFLQSKNDIALENIADALKWFSENPSEQGYAKALYIKGNIYESFGDYEKALEFTLRSQKLASEINDTETEAEAASLLGLIYTRLGNFSLALDYYQSALKIREELNDENAVASSLNRIGMIMRLIKKYDDSLEYYFKSLEIRKRNKQKSSIPWTLLGIASTFEDLGKNEEALDYYLRGMVGGDIRCTLQCMMGSGRILRIKGDYKKAEGKLKEALRIAQDLKASSLVAEAYSSLAILYETTGEVENALENYKLFQKTRESVQSEEAKNRFRNIEIANAIEKSEHEKEIYRLRHVELKQAYNLIEEQNKDITASINSAKRIQKAILPNPAEIRGLAGRSFILNIPKDIVSGDFFWFAQSGDKFVIAVADCTDHGVPGALMTMLGISFLDKIVKQEEITDTNLILNELRKEVKRSLHQTGKRNEEKNGMDISICTIDRKQHLLQFSGAFNNLYLYSNDQLIEYMADRMPIGIYEDEERQFSRDEINYTYGDIIYLLSDGYSDQFGGPDRKKFKTPALKSLLSEIGWLPLQTQLKKLETEFYKWKGNEPQTDDVLIVGLRLW